MEPTPSPRESKGLTSIDGAMALIVVLLVVQVWLLTATLESYLAGHYDAAVPGAILSGALFAACVGLFLFVESLDATIRRR